MTSNRSTDAAQAAKPGVQGIDDVILPGTTAPDDWAERIFAGRPTGGPAHPPVPDPRPRSKPCDPGLARAIRAMRQ